jgi:two-component system chemotaxis response regulator CheY
MRVKKALVIDDSRAMRMIISQTLAGCGFEVVQAANGRLGLEKMDREGTAFHVVLVDWNMPELNGLEFVQQVRANPAFNGVPLVMVTTETEIEQMARALEAGANEYVMKPFTREVIEDKLRLVGVIQ